MIMSFVSIILEKGKDSEKEVKSEEKSEESAMEVESTDTKEEEKETSEDGGRL